jgi:hypothetical protein
VNRKGVEECDHDPFPSIESIHPRHKILRSGKIEKCKDYWKPTQNRQDCEIDTCSQERHSLTKYGECMPCPNYQAPNINQ